MLFRDAHVKAASPTAPEKPLCTHILLVSLDPAFADSENHAL